MYQQQKIEIRNPSLFITNYIPSKLRAFLVAKKIPATVFEPPVWSASLIGKEIQIKNEVKTVIVLNKEYEEGLMELIKKLRQIAALTNIDVFWILKNPNSRYILNIVGNNRNITLLEDKNEDWPEIIREIAHHGIDFEAGNRARREQNFGELPRKRRNSSESFYVGVQSYGRKEKINEREYNYGPSRKRERSVVNTNKYREDSLNNRSHWNKREEFKNIKWPNWYNRDKESFNYQKSSKWDNKYKEDYGYRYNKHTNNRDSWNEKEDYWKEKREKNKEWKNREFNKESTSKRSLEEDSEYSQSTSYSSKGLEENYQIKEKYSLPESFLEEIKITDKESNLNKVLEKNAKEMLNENWQIILEKEYYEIKKLLVEKLEIKIQLFGSTLSNLCTAESDIDSSIWV
ncbi:hypothetical protein ACQ4LE_003764 [Meloidogyne hapla]